MRVPRHWLQEYASPDLTTAELADRLDMTGTKVERVERFGVGDASAFVVGRVLAADPHPAADRLSVCRVDVGDGEAAQIVCGAPNVAAGQLVDGDVRRAVLLQPLHGDAHQPNCSRKRASLS